MWFVVVADGLPSPDETSAAIPSIGRLPAFSGLSIPVGCSDAAGSCRTTPRLYACARSPTDYSGVRVGEFSRTSGMVKCMKINMDVSHSNTVLLSYSTVPIYLVPL